MQRKTAFIRWVVVPACLLWGVVEVFALLRARIWSATAARPLFDTKLR
ncbi:MAG: hypothetical protein H7Y28_13495 [Rhodoferax sp.]|nr:hypothetical protein [Rhodoferax sp.]